MRNNEQRTGARPSTESDAPKMPNPMDFITPTQFVELPSLGKHYDEGHPLHNQETIEIRFMTSKDEDILTSRSLLKKGLAIDRLINNLIVDENINPSSLLVGDRYAILVAARASAYGHFYETSVSCPSCNTNSKHTFNLLEPTVSNGGDFGEFDVTRNENGSYAIKLPYTEMLVEVRMLNGNDETRLIQHMQKTSKNKLDVSISDHMTTYVVSVNGYKDPKIISHVIKNITATESRYLRNAYKTIAPDLKINGDFECPSCGNEQELEVPFGADFFWPDR
jgi:rubredoxin